MEVDEDELVASQSQSDFIPPSEPSGKLNQSQLNDLVRDVGLSKSKAEFLASRLKDYDVLQWMQEFVTSGTAMRSLHHFLQEAKVSCIVLT